MSMEKLPLLSEQIDRLAMGAWVEDHGLGVDSRMTGPGFRLTGPLDISALRSSVTALVTRHEALRAAFPEQGRAGYQVIHPPRDVELAERDVSALPAEDRPGAAVKAVAEYLSRNPDVDGGLLLSAVVVRLADDDHLLGLAADHLVMDGESMEIVIDELWRLYEAATRGERAELPEQQFTYRDFVRWEADWLVSDPAPQRAIARFRELLDGLGPNPPVTLNGARRETNQGYTVGVAQGSLSDEAFKLLPGHCRASRTTPFVVLFSAYACALHACGGPTDLGVVIPITRRTEERFLNLVCMLSTAATVRVRLDLSLSFRDLNRQLRSVVMEAHTLAQVPAPVVTAELAPHMLGRPYHRPSTFFDAAPAGWSGGRRTVGALVAEPVGIPFDLTWFDSVSMFASVSDQEAGFTMLYPSDVFDESGIGNLAQAFTTVLDRCLREPETPIGALLDLIPTS